MSERVVVGPIAFFGSVALVESVPGVGSLAGVESLGSSGLTVVAIPSGVVVVVVVPSGTVDVVVPSGLMVVVVPLGAAAVSGVSALFGCATPVAGWFSAIVPSGVDDAVEVGTPLEFVPGGKVVVEFPLGSTTVFDASSQLCETVPSGEVVVVPPGLAAFAGSGPVGAAEPSAPPVRPPMIPAGNLPVKPAANAASEMNTLVPAMTASRMSAPLADAFAMIGVA